MKERGEDEKKKENPGLYEKGMADRNKKHMRKIPHDFTGSGAMPDFSGAGNRYRIHGPDYRRLDIQRRRYRTCHNRPGDSA
mgnify:CR=1 FL=1